MGDTKLAEEIQVGGSHYKKYAIQPYRFCYVNKLNNLQSEAISYIVRFRDKGGVSDLKKAKHTIDLLIDIYNEEMHKEDPRDVPF